MPSSDPTSISRRTFVAGAAATAVAASTRTSARADENNSKPLRIAQIGMQGHFGDIVSGVPLIDNCDLVAIAKSFPDEDILDMRKFAAVTDKTKVYDDWRKMLDEVKPDIVATFAPYAHNGPINIEAARRGCHVISEKPIAATMDELDTLRRERDKNNVRVTAMLSMRFNPAFTAAHRAIRDGLIGEPLLMSTQKSYQWGNNRPWFYKQREDYGGSIPWVAIHAIDFIRYITGLDYAEVTARQTVKLHRDYPGCEDIGALLFTMNNGGFTTLTFDYLRPKKAPSHGDDRIRVAGTKGIVEVRLNKERFCELLLPETEPKQLDMPTPESHNLPLINGKLNAVASFIAELRGESQHFLTPEDPFRATEVALKSRTAADTRKTVKL